MNDYIKKQDVKDLIECNKDLDGNDAIVWIEKGLDDIPTVSAEYIVNEVWKSGYINGYNKSQKEAYEKGKEVGKEEMYRQMTGTLA